MYIQYHSVSTHIAGVLPRCHLCQGALHRAAGTLTHMVNWISDMPNYMVHSFIHTNRRPRMCTHLWMHPYSSIPVGIRNVLCPNLTWCVRTQAAGSYCWYIVHVLYVLYTIQYEPHSIYTVLNAPLCNVCGDPRGCSYDTHVNMCCIPGWAQLWHICEHVLHTRAGAATTQPAVR